MLVDDVRYSNRVVHRPLSWLLYLQFHHIGSALRWECEALQTLLPCWLGDNVQSIDTPRLFTHSATGTRTSPWTTASILLLARSLAPVLITVASDLLGFRASSLVVYQLYTALKQLLSVTNSASAQLTPLDRITAAIGATYNENRHGPGHEPWGIPNWL